MIHGGWSIYSGVVVEDRIATTKIIKVLVPELLPSYTGNIEDVTTIEEIEVKVIDKINKSEPTNKSISVKSSNVIIADYMDILPNILYPPFVKKGEDVIILQYKDEDKFYWLPLGFKRKLHTQEVFRLFVSNVPDNSEPEEPNSSNSYFIELDTLFKKRILVKTSKRDGEPYEYTFRLDASQSVAEIKDDNGNSIVIDSLNRRVRLANTTGNFFELVDDIINMGSVKEINIFANKQILMQAPKIVTNENYKGS